MNNNSLRIGQIVEPLNPNTIQAMSPSYTPSVIGGVIVGIDTHSISVIWVDYKGPYDHTVTLNPTHVVVTPPRPRRWWTRRGATNIHTPALRIANHKIYGNSTSRTYDLDFRFETLEDANEVIRLIATAKKDFRTTSRRDRTNRLRGARAAVTQWPWHTDVFRIYQPVVID